MKKNIQRFTMMITASLFMNAAFAQKGFDLGFRYLLTESAIFNKSDKGSNAIKRENTVSYLSGGLAFGYTFNKNTGIELDVIHSRQGQSYSGTNTLNGTGPGYNHQAAITAASNNDQTLGSYQTKAELNVIKIPVLLRLTTDNTKRVFFTLNLGPQLDLLQSAVLEYNGEDVELPGTGIEPKDAYKKATVDGVIALGADFKVSRHWDFTAQARFDKGFSDVENKDLTYNFNNVQQRYYDPNRGASHNATAALMLGFSYKF